MSSSFCLEWTNKTPLHLHVQEETRRRALTDAGYLKGVLLEVQRLWPPFIGGRRIADQVGLLTVHPADFHVALTIALTLSKATITQMWS